jgi:hypothetical protein
VLDNALASSNHPIPYTPVCSAGSFRVCVHPAYQSYLSWVTGALDPVIAQVSGLPGAPTSARDISSSLLSPAVNQGFGVGQIARGSYEFSLNGIPFSPTQSMVEDSLRQDLVHWIIIGSVGTFVTTSAGGSAWQPDPGTPAQQAVMDGLLKAFGTPPYPVPQPNGNGPAPVSAQVLAAAAKFAALPAATRHAWLVANLTALKAGTVTLAQLPRASLRANQ